MGSYNSQHGPFIHIRRPEVDKWFYAWERSKTAAEYRAVLQSIQKTLPALTDEVIEKEVLEWEKEHGMSVIWKTRLTKEEAAAYAATGWYKNKTTQEIVDFQLFEDRLCMPIDLFHKALEEALGRPVKSEEFSAKGLARLQHEYNAKNPAFDGNK